MLLRVNLLVGAFIDGVAARVRSLVLLTSYIVIIVIYSSDGCVLAHLLWLGEEDLASADYAVLLDDFGRGSRNHDGL